MPPDPLRSFAEDRELLLEAFRQAVSAADGDEVLALHERTVDLARAAREGDSAAEAALEAEVASLGVADAERLVRSLTRWFQLINLAEDNERIRRLRRREASEAPSPGGVRCATRWLG